MGHEPAGLEFDLTDGRFDVPPAARLSFLVGGAGLALAVRRRRAADGRGQRA